MASSAIDDILEKLIRKKFIETGDADMTVSVRNNFFIRDLFLAIFGFLIKTKR